MATHTTQGGVIALDAHHSLRPCYNQKHIRRSHFKQRLTT